MKFTIQTILSLPIDGASSHLLIINNKIKILLDCGISHTFDFSKYTKRTQQLKAVSLVLISHSCLEYSGAMPFLIDELNLNPKIFYTTQPIMRYSPLNLHEELLIVRLSSYCKKIFNRLYRLYQSINIVKTQQKKAIEVGDKEVPALPQTNSNPSTAMETEETENIGQVDKIIYFTSYSAGGGTGSLAWRISFGIVNILYLVEYNNYSLYHIDGLDLNLLKQPIDILITDAYKQVDDEKMKKSYLKEKVKDFITKFYIQNGLLPSKPRPITTQQNEPKLLITCYPNELLIQLMAVIKKVFQQLQPPENREKIKVIHLSSRFLQLVKSQIDHFSDFFKDSLQNMEQFYIHSKSITSRINIAPVYALQGILNDIVTNSNNNVTICHLGNPIDQKTMNIIHQQSQKNINMFKIMTGQDKIISSANIMEEQVPQKRDIMEGQHKKDKNSDSQDNQDYTEINRESEKSQIDQQYLEQENQFMNHQPIHGKHISQIGFPHFIPKAIEQDHNFDDYGLRHQYPRFEERKTIQQYNKQLQNRDLPLQSLTKKNSTIEVMNIDFKITDAQNYRPVNYNAPSIKYLGFLPQRTNFSSSVHLMLALDPRNIVMINTKSQQSLVRDYKETFRNFANSSTKFYNLSDKYSVHLQLPNQLISYKLNYLPIETGTKLQKVHGVIKSQNGVIIIHLECLDEKQCLEFRLDQFYKRIKNQHNFNCQFTRNGIYIDGVKVSREDKQIILDGHYSEQYFRVRKMLYEFLGLQ